MSREISSHPQSKRADTSLALAVCTLHKKKVYTLLPRRFHYQTLRIRHMIRPRRIPQWKPKVHNTSGRIGLETANLEGEPLISVPLLKRDYLKLSVVLANTANKDSMLLFLLPHNWRTLCVTEACRVSQVPTNSSKIVSDTQFFSNFPSLFFAQRGSRIVFFRYHSIA